MAFWSDILNQDQFLTVSQLTGLIKTMLEGSFGLVQLKGEISNYRPNSSGHLYFTLKDSDSQISAVMFRGKALGLSFIPKDGMMVNVVGSISVYAPRGNYQIIINKMTKAGAGDIMEMIEERKKKLAMEGLFDSARKRPLPRFPKTIGVVTGAGGAAVRDIINVTKSRNPKMNVVVLPATVQGEDAAPTIIHMIKVANRYKLCDVLIVGRGGGSLEDLLPFSDEEVVRAVANSEIPVVSAVGHEIDWALCDYAADFRASTPSHAAEVCVPRLQDIVEQIQMAKQELYDTIQNRLSKLRLMLRTFKPEGMELQFRSIEQPLLNRLEDAKEKLEKNMELLIKEKRNLINQSVQILETANPQTIFDRGYSMVTDEEGNVIRDSSKIKSGDRITVRPANGKILAEVLKTE